MLYVPGTSSGLTVQFLIEFNKATVEPGLIGDPMNDSVVNPSTPAQLHIVKQDIIIPIIKIKIIVVIFILSPKIETFIIKYRQKKLIV